MHERIITAGRVKGNRPEGMTSRRSPAGDRSHVADRLEFETPVYCTDGKLGELADVVIAPRSMRVVDLVVRPRHMGGPARLVPIEAAEGSAWDESIHLTCSMDEASGFPAIQEAAVMRMGEVPSGDIWGRRDVTIPISCLARLETDQVVLGISRHEVGALPSVRIHRTWFG
jgi:hypothetical protein